MLFSCVAGLVGDLVWVIRGWIVIQMGWTVAGELGFSALNRTFDYRFFAGNERVFWMFGSQRVFGCVGQLLVCYVFRVFYVEVF